MQNADEQIKIRDRLALEFTVTDLFIYFQRVQVGRDHELVLQNMLTENKVSFIDEETQRQQGQDVTPDFRLQVSHLQCRQIFRE